MRIHFTAGLVGRLLGLLPGGAVLDDDEVLVLVPCHDIHTFGMRCAIDVAFLDSAGRVMRTYSGLPPSRHLACPGAVCTMERIARGPSSRGEVPAGMEVEGERPWLHTGETVELGIAERIASEERMEI